MRFGPFDDSNISIWFDFNWNSLLKYSFIFHAFMPNDLSFGWSYCKLASCGILNGKSVVLLSTPSSLRHAQCAICALICERI